MQGTDPFFPEQSDISPELEADVSDFLTNAIELEIEAYRNGTASIASSVMAGDVFAALEATSQFSISRDSGRDLGDRLLPEFYR